MFLENLSSEKKYKLLSFILGVLCLFLLYHIRKTENSQKENLDIEVQQEALKNCKTEADYAQFVKRFSSQYVYDASMKYCEKRVRSLINDRSSAPEDFSFVRAIVVPQSDVVKRGDVYKATAVLAYIDTSATCFINGEKIPKGNISIACGSAGSKAVSGYMEKIKPDGIIARYVFERNFVVEEP